MNRAEKFYAASRPLWRKWLLKNHAKKTGVGLVYDKAVNGKRKLSVDDITEEALCFGWIDSVPKALSQSQAMIYVAPRKPASNWSRLNRQRAERMILAKKMTKAGQSLIDLAKKTGTWTALKEVQNSVVPSDLKKEFLKSKKAWKNFENFPPSSKRIILEWILNAKKPETRLIRIKETVSLAVKNIRANHFRQ